MTRELTIQFSVTGHCTQTVLISNDCPLSDEEIIAGLNGGAHHVVTTVQESGDLDHYHNTPNQGDATTIGKVVLSDVDGEYTDFEEINRR